MAFCFFFPRKAINFRPVFLGFRARREKREGRFLCSCLRALEILRNCIFFVIRIFGPPTAEGWPCVRPAGRQQCHELVNRERNFFSLLPIWSQKQFKKKYRTRALKILYLLSAPQFDECVRKYVCMAWLYKCSVCLTSTMLHSVGLTSAVCPPRSRILNSSTDFATPFQCYQFNWNESLPSLDDWDNNWYYVG